MECTFRVEKIRLKKRKKTTRRKKQRKKKWRTMTRKLLPSGQRMRKTNKNKSEKNIKKDFSKYKEKRKSQRET